LRAICGPPQRGLIAARRSPVSRVQGTTIIEAAFAPGAVAWPYPFLRPFCGVLIDPYAISAGAGFGLYCPTISKSVDAATGLAK
jgi:hypothetical protein